MKIEHGPDLSVVDVPEVVESPSDTDAIAVFLADFEMPATADDGLFELAHHLERVAEVARGLSLAESVPHRSGQRQVVFVILERKLDDSWKFSTAKLKFLQKL